MFGVKRPKRLDNVVYTNDDGTESEGQTLIFCRRCGRYGLPSKFSDRICKDCERRGRFGRGSKDDHKAG